MFQLFDAEAAFEFVSVEALKMCRKGSKYRRY